MTETTVYGIESASHWDCSVFNKEHGHNFGHICVYQPKFECQSKSLKCKQDPELTVLCYVNKDWPMHYTSCFDLQLPYKPPPFSTVHEILNSDIPLQQISHWIMVC